MKLTFCSEQTLGNQGTQSYGAKSEESGMSAEPPGASRRAALFLSTQAKPTELKTRLRYLTRGENPSRFRRLSLREKDGGTKTYQKPSQIQRVAATLGAVQTAARRQDCRSYERGTNSHYKHEFRGVFLLHIPKACAGNASHHGTGCLRPSPW
jgi:hypothetical protein